MKGKEPEKMLILTLHRNANMIQFETENTVSGFVCPEFMGNAADKNGFFTGKEDPLSGSRCGPGGSTAV